MESNRNKCHYCICKTCMLAYENGGADGCGNCLHCNYTTGCQNCEYYYNPTPVQINYKRRKQENENVD